MVFTALILHLFKNNLKTDGCRSFLCLIRSFDRFKFELWMHHCLMTPHFIISRQLGQGAEVLRILFLYDRC